MGNGLWQNYLKNNQRECDKWLKANAVFGSILAIAMLAMAVVGHYSAGAQRGDRNLSCTTVISK